LGNVINLVVGSLIILGIGITIYYLIKNIRDKKRAVPVYGLSYSGEYSKKKFWTNEIIMIVIVTQGFGLLKLSMTVNILMLSFVIILIILYFTQIWRGAIGKNGIVSATKFYDWKQIDKVDWITGLQAENPGYPTWGLVRFYMGNHYVEFIIKKKIEDEVRTFVKEQLELAKAKLK
jgi:hypothetical protein